MEDATRRGLAGLAMSGAVAASLAGTGANPAQAATSPDSLDALAKAKGFTGFGSAIGGGAEDFSSSFHDSGARIFTCDVVNETVDEATGEIRDTPFTRCLAGNVVDICFDAAHKAPPRA